jgi:hypothetical protein
MRIGDLYSISFARIFSLPRSFTHLGERMVRRAFFAPASYSSYNEERGVKAGLLNVALARRFS